jgi:hypothetical protein
MTAACRTIVRQPSLRECVYDRNVHPPDLAFIGALSDVRGSELSLRLLTLPTGSALTLSTFSSPTQNLVQFTP